MQSSCAETRRDLNYWVERLSSEELPIFANTVRSIARFANEEMSSAAELARVILQDPMLTSGVLKMANSVYYRAGSQAINTVTRAVVLLGFDTVRSMCLSVAVVEALGNGRHRKRVEKELATVFHAAYQAKAFSSVKNKKPCEETFIAALLYRLGEITFWCFSGEDGQELDEAMGRTPGYAEKAEQEVLGFTLRQLTVELAENWKLSSLLRDALNPGSGSDPRVKHILLAQKLVCAAENGWKSPEVQKLLRQLANYLNLPLAKTAEMVEENAQMAVRMLKDFGAARASRLIPLHPHGKAEDFPEILEQDHPRLQATFPEPNPALKFSVLSELSSMLMERQIDLSLLVSMVLEGILRGVGMDRTLFALLTRDKCYLRARVALGWKKDILKQDFNLKVATSTGHLFIDDLDMQRAVWVENDPQQKVASLLSGEIKRINGDAPFFFMPVGVGGKPIGLIYADRKPSNRQLDDEAFDGFRLLCQQFNLALAVIEAGRQ